MKVCPFQKSGSFSPIQNNFKRTEKSDEMNSTTFRMSLENSLFLIWPAFEFSIETTPASANEWFFKQWTKTQFYHYLQLKLDYCVYLAYIWCLFSQKQLKCIWVTALRCLFRDGRENEKKILYNETIAFMWWKALWKIVVSLLQIFHRYPSLSLHVLYRFYSLCNRKIHSH